MLVNTGQWTGQSPTAKHYSDQNANTAEAEKPQFRGTVVIEKGFTTVKEKGAGDSRGSGLASEVLSKLTLSELTHTGTKDPSEG